jgi:hypothetical protein
MSSSIEILIDALKEVILTEQESILASVLFEHVKEIHKHEIIDAQSYAVSNAIMSNNKGYFDCDKYYQETFKKVI